jgi:HAD superfamily hydrolase (TIGR01450 family)
VRLEEIYNSTHATALYLMEQGTKYVYCLGTDGLIEELHNNNINITDDPTKVKALIIGLHHDFNYFKLMKALNIIIKSNCKIIACNRDRNYPVEDNKIMPGCGAIVAAVEEATGKKIDFLVGKPHTYMIELLAKDWNFKNNEILVVGDSIETDIEMAKRYKCPSILISSAKSNFASDETIVIDNILSLKELFNRKVEESELCKNAWTGK